VLATVEKTQCYSLFDEYAVRVEGPEFSQDFTYYLIHKMAELSNFERGIVLPDFNAALVTKKIELEFRTLQKMCFHKDHVLNLFTSFDIQFHKINRYKDILPFLHNRVVLRENPILQPNQTENSPNTGIAAAFAVEDGDSSNQGAFGKSEANSNLIDIHGSDARLQTYFNASYINSMIRSRYEEIGSSYIASSSPGLKTSSSRFTDDDAAAD